MVQNCCRSNLPLEKKSRSAMHTSTPLSDLPSFVGAAACSSGALWNVLAGLSWSCEGSLHSAATPARLVFDWLQQCLYSDANSHSQGHSVTRSALLGIFIEVWCSWSLLLAPGGGAEVDPLYAYCLNSFKSMGKRMQISGMKAAFYSTAIWNEGLFDSVLLLTRSCSLLEAATRE